MKYELVELRIEPGKYIIKKTDDNGVEWWIPIEESNADYQAYLAWVEENK